MIDSMMRAFVAAGEQVHLLAYPHEDAKVAYKVHRFPNWGIRASARSGPSLSKVALDVSGIAALRHLNAKLRPKMVVAHHVEAGWLCRAARVRPDVFVAHTTLEEELGYYFPFGDSFLRSLGRQVDSIASFAARTMAVSPLLASQLARFNARYLPLPWEMEPSSYQESTTCRLLYAGNLDAYQGWETMLRGVALARVKNRALRLRIATASDPRMLLRFAEKHHLQNVVEIMMLSDDHSRRRAYDDVAVVLVPRLAPGGIPIKLLDALSRSMPVVAESRALAGLALEDVVERCENDSPASWAFAIERALCRRKSLSLSAESYIRQQHKPEAFASAFLHWQNSSTST